MARVVCWPDGRIMNVTRAEIFITAAQEAALILLSKGLCIKKMATELGISESAVKARLSSVRQKLAVHTNIQAVVEALRLGYLNGARVVYLIGDDQS